MMRIMLPPDGMVMPHIMYEVVASVLSRNTWCEVGNGGNRKCTSGFGSGYKISGPTKWLCNKLDGSGFMVTCYYRSGLYQRLAI